jgi:outer membrane receptor protein involved in Fe transport
MPRPPCPFNRSITRLLLCAALVGALSNKAFAQPTCQLDEAARAYAAGALEQTRQLIDSCLSSRATEEQRIQAYALLAKLSLAVDDVDAAQQAVAALLGVMPDFAPALDDPPRFVQLIAQFRRELSRTTTTSVSKMNESLREAPATVIVVTAEQIRRRGYLDLEQVLHDLPGFDISRSNGYSYSNIYQRGFRSDTTSRTLFLVDGVEQNDLHSNTAHISRQFPLTNIDRVEVVYGPASTMYGANAFLGVINVITKDPDDVIAEGKQIGADVQVGGGAWSTKFIDATVAGRYRGATLSLTGRVYKSDEWDLSKYENWNYNPVDFASNRSLAQYRRILNGSGIGPFQEEFPDEFGDPVALDQSALKANLNGRPIGFSELTDDWWISGRLKLKNFTAGLQAWQRREGATSEGTDMEVPGALNGNIWIPRETSFFVRYAAPLSGSLSFSYFGQAKVHSVGEGSSVFSLNSYLNGPLDAIDLFYSNTPSWTQALVAQSSSQIRNELNLVFRPTNTFNIVGGVDLRNGSIQADYVKGSDCRPFGLFSDFGDGDLKNGVKDNKDNIFVVGRIFQLLAPAQPTGGVWIHCNQTGDAASLPASGGEHFAVRDIGAFAQASYKPNQHVKIVAGWRVDNDHVSQGSGFGTVFTPRLGIIYSPRGFVTKAIYSEGFKEPSSLERFTTLPGVLARPDLPLQPERARNFEISVGRQWGRFAADVAAYQTNYSTLVTLEPHLLASEPEIRSILQGFGNIPQPKNLDEYKAGSDMISAALPAIIDRLLPKDCSFGDLQCLRRNQPSLDLLRKLFDDPLFVQKFENSEALRVRGVEANASYSYGSTDVFGNYTYTSPIRTETTNEILAEGRTRSDRLGDIAAHKLNLGVQHRWRQIDLSARMNYVGARPTWQSNPLSELPRYSVANVAVSYVDFLPGFTAQLVINNIFSSSYADPGVRTADNIRFASSIPQPGRSIFVKLLARQVF